MKKFYYTHILFLTVSLFVILPNAKVYAIRNAPITSAGTIASCPNHAGIMVPILVTGFTNITSFSLRIEFNPNVASFMNLVANQHFTSVIVNVVPISPTLSKLMIVWSDYPPVSLSSSDTLAKLTFNFINSSTALTFNNESSGGGDCEYSDENGNPMNDVPTSTYYINGAINSLGVGATGSITGSGSVCLETNGVAYSISQVTNATSYSWSLPSGFSIATGANTNSITVNVSSSASSGNFSVVPSNSCGPGSSSPPFSVTVNTLPVPTITGTGFVCTGTQSALYTTEPGMTDYTWSVSSGGIIMTGQGTFYITVNWNTPGAQTVSVNYTNTNSCRASNATVKNVTVNPLPCDPAIGQVSINSDNSQPDLSAMLDVKATDRGLLIPRISTVTRDLIPSPAAGLIIFNTTTNRFDYFNGNYWYELEIGFISSATGTLSAGGGVSINALPNEQPENSAMLDVNNPTRGILIPRTIPGLIVSPAIGLIIYNIATNLITYYNGTQWASLNAISTGIPGATGSQTSEGLAIKIDNSSPDPSAMLDVYATNKGILIPRLTTAQRDVILPVTGLCIYNLSTNNIEFYNGSGWYRLITN